MFEYEDDLLNDQIQENALPSDDEQDNAEGREDNDAVEQIKLEPKKRSVRNPRSRLTVEILQGPRGIHTIEDYFKDIKFLGKRHEDRDLAEVMRRLKHWAHRMYPRYAFDDVAANIERLSRKKPLQVHMSRYRLGLLESQQIIEQQLANEDDEEDEQAQEEPFDEFDALLGEQIANSKLVAPKTPNVSRPPSSMSMTSSSINTPGFRQGAAIASTPHSTVYNLEDSDLAQPLPPSQPEAPLARKISPKKSGLSSDQLAKIAENRRLALEKLKARKAQQTN